MMRLPCHNPQPFQYYTIQREQDRVYVGIPPQTQKSIVFCFLCFGSVVS